MTELSQRHFVDERGYTTCRSCGFVSTDFSVEAQQRGADDWRDFNWTAKLLHREVGSTPFAHGRNSGVSAADLVLGSARRRQLVRDAEVLRDAETLCSFSDIRGDVKTAVLAAVESYYGDEARRRVRIEAALIAITELVTSRFGCQFDSPKAASAFNVSNDQIRTARNSVGRWFDTYWVK